MSDGKNGFSNSPEFDFTPIGQAIKKARVLVKLFCNTLFDKYLYVTSFHWRQIIIV